MSDIQLHHGDCLDVMRTLADASVDAIVTDPPYGLGFMGREWDNLPPGLPWAQECLRVLKPGGHLLAFGGTRTWHRLACAVEDAGFEVRDSIAWMYGSGFPKSLDVSKAIDKAARGVPQGGADPTSPNHGRYRTTTTEGKRWDGDSGQGYGAGGSRFLADGMASGSATGPAASGGAATASDADPAAFLASLPDESDTPDEVVFTEARRAEREAMAEKWQGWGTALKPAFEPIVVARKPLAGTVAGNVLAHGTGALNIAGCRIAGDDNLVRPAIRRDDNDVLGKGLGAGTQDNPAGRWPANVVLDESQAAALDEQSGELTSGKMMPTHTTAGVDGRASAYGADAAGGFTTMETYGDSGGASRFFYVAKADASERVRVNGTAHPTVKPLALMRWLVRLVTPPGGTVLEPFAGSGTTVEACLLEGFDCIAIEREADYLPLIRQRIARRRDPVEAVRGSGEDGGLFDLLDGEAS